MASFVCEDVDKAEKVCHRRLESFRKQKNREFFDIEFTKLIEIVKEALKGFIKSVDFIDETLLKKEQSTDDLISNRLQIKTDKPKSESEIANDVIVSCWQKTKRYLLDLSYELGGKSKLPNFGKQFTFEYERKDDPLASCIMVEDVEMIYPPNNGMPYGNSLEILKLPSFELIFHSLNYSKKVIQTTGKYPPATAKLIDEIDTPHFKVKWGGNKYKPEKIKQWSQEYDGRFSKIDINIFRRQYQERPSLDTSTLIELETSYYCFNNEQDDVLKLVYDEKRHKNQFPCDDLEKFTKHIRELIINNIVPPHSNISSVKIIDNPLRLP